MALRIQLHRCRTTSWGTAFGQPEECASGVSKAEAVCSFRAPGATRRETTRCRTGAYLLTVCIVGPGSALHRYTLQRVRDTRSPLLQLVHLGTVAHGIAHPIASLS